MTDLFDDQLAAWKAYVRTPWARIRYAVVGEVLRRQADALGQRLRVLDVGGGDAQDALPLAVAGHHVTVLDPSPAWLAEARRRAGEAGVALTTAVGGLDDLPEGAWDLVLCHFVLRYRPAGAGDVAALAARVRPGGRLSLVEVNPDGRVLRSLLHDGPAAALEELDAERAGVETFRTTARKVRWTDARDEAQAAGLRVRGLFGNRIANDLLVDEAAKHDPAFHDELLALELKLCDLEPFNRVGFAWHLVLERPGRDYPR